jgi:hypothetical protein
LRIVGKKRALRAETESRQLEAYFLARAEQSALKKRVQFKPPHSDVLEAVRVDPQTAGGTDHEAAGLVHCHYGVQLLAVDVKPVDKSLFGAQRASVCKVQL